MMGPKGSNTVGGATQLLEALANPDEFKKKLEEFATKEQRANEAEQKASSILSHANAERNKIINEAQDVASSIINAAKSKAEKIVVEAERKLSDVNISSNDLSIRIENQDVEYQRQQLEIASREAELNEYELSLANLSTHLDEEHDKISRIKKLASEISLIV
jgi:vacuolar-type H+-ATPase subunit H